MRAFLPKAFAAGLAGLLTACAPGSTNVYPVVQEAPADARPAVIFVHGYYGSALRDVSTKERLFVTPWQTLWGKRPIALEASALGARPSPDLEVEGLFGSVAVLPFLYGITVYTPMMDSLAAGGANHVVAYAYDWRKELQPAAAGLADLVASLKKAGAPRVSIVAHSMGGLVTSYYLGYGRQKVESARLSWEGAREVSRVVFLGTPFRGAMSILRNMQHGTGYPWNKDLLEPETVSSWGASYHILPLLDDKVVGGDGRPRPLPLGEPATWEAWKLGYYHLKAPTAEVSAARAAYVKKQLAAATRFLSLVQLEGGPPPAALRVLNITGEGKPTLAKAYAHEGKHEFLFLEGALEKIGKPVSLLQEDGDGTVPLSSAALPAALEAKGAEIRSNFAHDKLFLDPKIEKEYQHFLSEGG
jgi:pimeloyl-ACP methyl ester carboxylesterase